MVKGKVFKVRFRAYGLNSSDVYRWSVDNINIFGLCPAPRNLFAYGPACSTNGALLSWNSPETQGSYSGNLLYEGFENGTFPPLYFTQNITNTTANNTSWSQSNASGTWGIHSGTGCCGLAYDFAHQDEWLIAHNILVTVNLSFWSHGYQGSLYLDHYYVKVSTNNGTTWSVLMDLSALSPAGWNNWNTPYVINLSDYFGMAVDIAWQAVDGDGGGLWYDWAIDDCSIGSKKITFGEYKNQLNTEEVIGYDIYRRKYNESAFIKINTQIVTDTTYCDPNVNSYLAYYFVTALFDTSNCIGSCTSDTVVPIWIGIPEKNENSIRVYPNPANDVLSVSCDNPVEHCELINLYGKSVYALREIRNRSFVIRIEEIPPGIYFINVTTSSGVGREKVVICH